MGEFRRVDAEREKRITIDRANRCIREYGDTANGYYAKMILTLSGPDVTDEQMADATFNACRACAKKTMKLVEYEDNGEYPAFCADCLRAALALLEPANPVTEKE